MFLQRDKQLHFALSALMVSWLYLLTKSMTAAILIAFLVGVAKEIMDVVVHEGGDINDIIANCVGIVAAVIIEVMLRS